MDRLIAANSVPQAQADIAPTTGTPQFATDGNPASNVPATRWPSYQYNAIQEELMAVLAAAGVAPDRTNNAQIVSAIRLLIAQSAAVIGDRRNLSMSVTAASASATLTADEIVVGTALGGQKYVLAGFSKSINLATTGAGGMDAGTAPVNGYVALYAIYNPTTGASALLATNATSTAVGNVYGGANMPSGYAASALVSVWPTNGSAQFVLGYQTDRSLAVPFSTIATTTTQISSLTALNVASFIPKNAKNITGFMNVSGNNATNTQVNIASSSSGVTQQQCSISGGTAGVLIGSATFGKVPIITPQTIYWSTNVQTGSFLSANIFCCGYDI
ncbi:hypothetical protein [Burkholderia multivorans]|uniref:hypothetical protein n=1 Tax=Burkholderia multivorans TaxID=87883 RepID=UPI0011B273E1|nr:hypothetical protein [Burkholderia multivorans]